MIRAQKVDKMEANSIYSQKLLKGKKAFVTGGATGLGKAIASGLSCWRRGDYRLSKIKKNFYPQQQKFPPRQEMRFFMMLLIFEMSIL